MNRLARLRLRSEAVGWLVMAWLALDVLPFKLYRKLLPAAVTGESTAWPADESSLHQNPLSKRIGLVVEDTARRLPFRSVCFHRGIAVVRMLRRRNIQATLHYGVAHVTGKQALRAHVWVSSYGRDVTGGSAKREFREIAHFPAGAQEYPFPSEERL